MKQCHVFFPLYHSVESQKSPVRPGAAQCSVGVWRGALWQIGGTTNTGVRTGSPRKKPGRKNILHFKAVKGARVRRRPRSVRTFRVAAADEHLQLLRFSRFVGICRRNCSAADVRGTAACVAVARARRDVGAAAARAGAGLGAHPSVPPGAAPAPGLRVRRGGRPPPPLLGNESGLVGFFTGLTSTHQCVFFLVDLSGGS